MNIFVVHTNPELAARQLCNKHVVKMTLETAQMLCTTAHVLKDEGKLDADLDIPYKRCHVNHPCTVWARQSLFNYHWLLIHGLSLASEYTHRYGKVHKSQAVIDWAMGLDVDVAFDNYDPTPFAQAMPDKYKRDNAVDAYRAYYMGEKARFAVWSKREPPQWWHEHMNTLEVA
jgi:hypothetical protein